MIGWSSLYEELVLVTSWLCKYSSDERAWLVKMNFTRLGKYTDSKMVPGLPAKKKKPLDVKWGATVLDIVWDSPKGIAGAFQRRRCNTHISEKNGSIAGWTWHWQLKCFSLLPFFQRTQTCTAAATEGQCPCAFGTMLTLPDSCELTPNKK